MSVKHDQQMRSLRERAETLLDQAGEQRFDLSPAEIRYLIHDLSVYQVELELQNEELRNAQHQLAMVRDQYVRLYHQAPVGYLTLDSKGLIQQVNQTFADQVGWERADLFGRALADFIVELDVEAFFSRFRAFYNNPTGKNLDLTLHGKQGRRFFARLTGRLEATNPAPSDSHPSQHQLLVIVDDISTRKAMEDTLRERESVLRSITDSAQDAIVMLDSKGRISFWNPAAETLFGYARDEVLGRVLHEFLAPERYREAHRAAFLDFQQTGRGDALGKTLALHALRKDGAEISVALSLSAVRIKNEWHAVGILRDETERLAYEQELRRLATTDHLTGLANRRHFLGQVEQELERFKRYARPMALLMLDLDHFKQVNDTHGHATGDNVLRHFAILAGHVFRRTDVLGRVGGEEFAALLPGTDLEGTRHLAERLRWTVANSPLLVEMGNVECTVSIGVTLFSPNDADAGVVLSRADRALYRAKDRGRNRVEVELP